MINYCPTFCWVGWTEALVSGQWIEQQQWEFSCLAAAWRLSKAHGRRGAVPLSAGVRARSSDVAGWIHGFSVCLSKQPVGEAETFPGYKSAAHKGHWVLWASEEACSWAPPSLFSSSFNLWLVLLFVLSISFRLCHHRISFFLFPAAYGSICLHFHQFRQLVPLPLLLKMSFKFSLSIWMLGVRAAGGSWSDISKMKHSTASQILAFRR